MTGEWGVGAGGDALIGQEGERTRVEVKLGSSVASASSVCVPISTPLRISFFSYALPHA